MAKLKLNTREKFPKPKLARLNTRENICENILFAIAKLSTREI